MRAGHQVAEPDDRLDLGAVGGQVVAHAGDGLGLVERGLGDFPGDAERLEHGGDALFLLDAVAGAGDFDRHPDEIALLQPGLVDHVLGPALADDREVGADIGVEVDGGVRRVEVDDRDAGGAGLLDDLDHAARIGAGGDDGVGLGGDRRAHRFLLRRHVAIVERGVDRLAGIRRPTGWRRPGSRSRPDRPGRHARSSRRSWPAAATVMASASNRPAPSSFSLLSILDFLPLDAPRLGGPDEASVPRARRRGKRRDGGWRMESAGRGNLRCDCPALAVAAKGRRHWVAARIAVISRIS